MSRWTGKTVTKSLACDQHRESRRINLGEKAVFVLFFQSFCCHFVGVYVPVLHIILSESCYLDETSPLVPFLYSHTVYSEIESHTMFAYKLNK